KADVLPVTCQRRRGHSQPTEPRLQVFRSRLLARLDPLRPPRRHQCFPQRGCRFVVCQPRAAVRRIGNKLLVPVVWLREQVNGAEPEPGPAPLDVDKLADRVADRLIARLALAFGSLASDVRTAGPGS